MLCVFLEKEQIHIPIIHIGNNLYIIKSRQYYSKLKTTLELWLQENAFSTDQHYSPSPIRVPPYDKKFRSPRGTYSTEVVTKKFLSSGNSLGQHKFKSGDYESPASVISPDYYTAKNRLARGSSTELDTNHFNKLMVSNNLRMERDDLEDFELETFSTGQKQATLNMSKYDLSEKAELSIKA
jgi:hypothetical protein